MVPETGSNGISRILCTRELAIRVIRRDVEVQLLRGQEEVVVVGSINYVEAPQTAALIRVARMRVRARHIDSVDLFGRDEEEVLVNVLGV